MSGLGDNEAPISDLVSKLVDDGKAYAKAEVELAKAKAEAKAGEVARHYRGPVILLVIAGMFAIAGITTLCMMIAISLAAMIGPVGGTIAGTMLALTISVILALIARSKLETDA